MKRHANALTSRVPLKRAKSSSAAGAGGTVPVFGEAQSTEIRRELLHWYDSSHRRLPWRRNSHSKLEESTEAEEKGPPLDLPQREFVYWVWVCEVMCQQTQVPRAAEYFKRWIRRWPTVKDLALANLDEVNEMWAGLGYYRRARFLLEGAKFVMRELHGVFPRSSEELQRIPGIGAYTAAAIASIACGEVVPVVDANVLRVLARLRCLDWDIKKLKPFSELAAKLIDPARPGDFNQAIMELGARICTPNQAPACLACPLQGSCHAFARQQQSADPSVMAVTDYPVKAAKTQRRNDFAAVLVVEFVPEDAEESLFLLVQRPSAGLLAGLWEFPSQLVPFNSSRTEDRRAMNSYLQDVLCLPFSKSQLDRKAREDVGQLTHVFSHIHLTLRVEKLVIKGVGSHLPAASGQQVVRWVTKSALEAQGLSSSVRKIWALLKAEQEISPG